MYGWRGRIGFIAPAAVIDTHGYDFYKLAPEGVLLLSANMGIDGLRSDTIESALVNLEKCARALAKFKADLIVFGGSPPVIHGGPGSGQRIIKRLEEITGLPALTSQESAIEAFHHFGAKRLAVASPFSDEQNEKLKVYLEALNFEVKSMKGMNIEHEEIRVLPIGASYRQAKEAFQMADGEVDLIYLPCAAWPTLENIEALEEDLGVPVVTSVQAMVWDSLRKLKISSNKNGYGRLLTN